MIGKPVALIQVPNQRLFSVQAAARYLGCDRKTLKKWTSLGLLHAKWIEGARHYTLDEMDRFIDEQPDSIENPSGRDSASDIKENHV